MQNADQNVETAMKRMTTLLSILLIATSGSAFAQNTQSAPSPATQGGAAVGKADSGSLSSGASSPGGQTLMQQREKGMSPDATSGADTNRKATGKIKQ